MEIISKNPFRILGMYANDSLDKMRANADIMHTLRELNQDCFFDNDFVGIFGPVDRSKESIDKAIKLLENEQEAKIYSYFWIHNTSTLNKNAVKAEQIISEESKANNNESYINIFICALFIEDFELALGQFVKIANSSKSSDNSVINEILHRTLRDLDVDDDKIPIVFTWEIFKDIFQKTGKNESLYNKIARIYYKESLYRVNEVTLSLINEPEIYDMWEPIYFVNKYVEPVIPVLKETLEGYDEHANSYNMHKDECQLALTDYSRAMIQTCENYYNNTYFWEAKPVEMILQLLRKIYIISYSNKAKQKCIEFGLKLKEGLKNLAPAELRKETEDIKIKLHIFSLHEEKKNTVSALDFINKCVPTLKIIRTKLGKDNTFYRQLSSHVGEKALNIGAKTLIKRINNYRAKQDNENIFFLVISIKDAKQLELNIKELDVTEDFLNEKVIKFTQLIEDAKKIRPVDLSDVIPTINLSQRPNLPDYNVCKDYISLYNYTKKYPDNIDAINKLWKMESEAFPSKSLDVNLYIKELVNYKKQFPYSHKDKNVLNEFIRLKDFLNKEQINFITKTWPKAADNCNLIERLDFCEYKEATNNGSYDTYLKLFPNGKYVDIIRKLKDNNFYSLCKEKGLYKLYLTKYPNGLHSKEAESFIRKKKQKIIIVLGFIIALFLLVMYIMNLSTNSNTKDSQVLKNKTTNVEFNKLRQEYEMYKENSLETGDKPYRKIFGKETKGKNYVDFETIGVNDYVVIIKKHKKNIFVNHTYIRGGESTRLYIPDGEYDFFFYSGHGWNPNYKRGIFNGAFLKNEAMQADSAVFIKSQHVTYKLYPVENGNLNLDDVDILDFMEQ